MRRLYGSSEQRYFNVTPPDILFRAQTVLGIKFARGILSYVLLAVLVVFLGGAVVAGLNFASSYILRERNASLDQMQAYVNKLGGREGSKRIADGEKTYAEWSSLPLGKNVVTRAFEGISYFKVFPLDYFGYVQKGNSLTVNVAVALDTRSPKEIQDRFYSIVETLRSKGWDVKYDSWGGNIGLLVTMTGTVGNI